MYYTYKAQTKIHTKYIKAYGLAIKQKRTPSFNSNLKFIDETFRRGNSYFY